MKVLNGKRQVKKPHSIIAKKTLARLRAISAALLLLVLFSACGTNKTVTPITEELTSERLSDVCELLRGGKLENVDVFEAWVKEFRVNTDSNLGDADFSDADCRMTAMLLMGNLIGSDSLEQDYRGTYLMFDLDAMEHGADYQRLLDKKDLFVTLFGEFPIENGAFEKALPDNWTRHGLRVNSERCALISLVFPTVEAEEAFVGHTGVLVDCRDQQKADSNYLFVEKIAFGDPFCVTKLNEPMELIELFSQRPDYSTEEGELRPAVYRNDEYLGSLKPWNPVADSQAGEGTEAIRGG